MYHWIITVQWNDGRGIATRTRNGTLPPEITSRSQALGYAKEQCQVPMGAVVLFFDVGPEEFPGGSG